MAEHPILFSGALVRAILDGRKTVTRRPMRPQPVGPVANVDLSPSSQVFAWHPSKPVVDGRAMPIGTHRFRLDPDTHGELVRRGCPFGGPGDRLWVRETWGAVDIRGYGAKTIGDVDQERDVLRYRADDHANPDYKPGIGGRWFPSIHMPRWASRLTLDVVDVRVERVQDIDEDDARREGVQPDEDLPPGFLWEGVDASTHRGAFAHAWARIYGENAWRGNPWVWRVEFKVAEVRRG